MLAGHVLDSSCAPNFTHLSPSSSARPKSSWSVTWCSMVCQSPGPSSSAPNCPLGAWCCPTSSWENVYEGFTPSHRCPSTVAPVRSAAIPTRNSSHIQIWISLPDATHSKSDIQTRTTCWPQRLSTWWKKIGKRIEEVKEHTHKPLQESPAWVPEEVSATYIESDGIYSGALSEYEALSSKDK